MSREGGRDDGALAPLGLLGSAASRRRAAWLLGILVVLLATVALALAYLGPGPEAVMARCRQGIGFDPLEVYPPRDASATARRIDELIAPLGLVIAPPDAPHRPVPDPEARKRLRNRRGALTEYARALRPETSLPQPPPEAAGVLDELRPVLRRVAAVLEESGAPRWDLHLDRTLWMAMPGSMDHRMLHRLLVLGAAGSAHRGHRSEALGWLEAAWTLRRGLEEGHPLLQVQIFTQAELRDELALLRVLEGVPSRWSRRLAAEMPRERIATALWLDAWMVVRAVQLGQLASSLGESDPERRVLGPLARYGALHYVELLEQDLERLAAMEPEALDRRGLHAELLERLPRWSTVARSMIPRFVPAYRRATRTALAVELTRQVLALRPAPGEGGASGALPAGHPSSVPGVEWIYRRTEPDGIVVRASDEPAPRTEAPLPLTVRLARPGA